MPDLRSILALYGILAFLAFIALQNNKDVTYICQNPSGEQIQCSELSVEYRASQEKTGQPTNQDAEYLDLLAQQSMADSTQRMAEDSSIDLWIGGIGLAALFYALYLNWQSTKAAVISAQQNRAWITFVDLENCGFLDSNQSHTGSPAFMFKLVNTGGTPARNITISAVCSSYLRERDNQVIRPPPLEVYRETGSVGFLGENAAYTTVITPHHEDWFRYVKENTHDLVFSLLVTYETVYPDVYGNTIFCKRISHDQRTSRMYSVTVGHCCFIE